MPSIPNSLDWGAVLGQLTLPPKCHGSNPSLGTY